MPCVFWHDWGGHGVPGIGMVHRTLIRLHLVMPVRDCMLRLSILRHMRGGPMHQA
jgi:hypothetical protein